MRIFYITTKSEIGGVQTHISQLAQYFVNKGNDVAVMAYPGGWLEKKTKDLGVVFYPNIFLSNSINPIKDLQAMEIIKRAIEDFKPDLVSCHSTKAGFLTRLAVRNKIPTIFTAHGWGFTEGVPFWRKLLLVSLEKLASRYCSKIICVSDFDRKLALKYKVAPPNKLTVIHNGVEIEKKENQKSKIKSLEEKIRIVFVGRLAQQKDPLLLLKAFNSLPSELKNKAQISIIGEGQKRKELEKFINENELEKKVKLLGGLPREKVFQTLKESNIFVLTSNWEGFPRSILEAISCGIAIIASDVGGVKEAIDNEIGFLVKRGDQNGVKEALEELLKNPSLIRKMGINAQKRAKEYFSLERMLKKTEQVYYEVTKE